MSVFLFGLFVAKNLQLENKFFEKRERTNQFEWNDMPKKKWISFAYEMDANDFQIEFAVMYA